MLTSSLQSLNSNDMCHQSLHNRNYMTIVNCTEMVKIYHLSSWPALMGFLFFPAANSRSLALLHRPLLKDAKHEPWSMVVALQLLSQPPAVIPLIQLYARCDHHCFMLPRTIYNLRILQQLNKYWFNCFIHLCHTRENIKLELGLQQHFEFT